MNKLKLIIEGYSNLLKEKVGISVEKDVEIFKARRDICDNCKHQTKLKVCDLCSCYIPSKTRSPNSKCPKNYW